jgi:solute carrier family 25 protein 34/35
VKEPYRNVFQAFILVAKSDGFLALQKGLVPSLYFQFILNACRLGIYTKATEMGLTKKADGSISILKSALIGGVGGFIGQALASPFFMLRTRLQSQAVQEIAVGYQHKHTGMISAFKEIYSKHGIQGLYRGVSITFPRAMMGSGTQIAAFGFTKDFFHRKTSVKNETFISFTSGLIAGTAMALAMTPPDVVATRIYNQGVDKHGKGIYYSGIIDCTIKIVKSEGLIGLYKGFWPHYIRIGPHSALVFLFFDELKALYIKLM